MQPLDNYRTLCTKAHRTDKESTALRYAGDKLFDQWNTAVGRATKVDHDQSVASLERLGNVFVEVYTQIVSCPPPLWADYEQEARRITPALIQYYNWLASLPRLTPARLQVFERIDALLRARFFSINLACLFAEDKQEIEAIAAVLHLELIRTHCVLSLTEEVTWRDGWYTDRRTYGSPN